MALNASRRSVMTLYSGATDPYSHMVRIVLAEKGVTYDIVDVQPGSRASEELAQFNPYGTVPTLVDRDLVLYQARIIMEYLDERFPHPPLMPVYPVAKGRARLMVHRIDKDWYQLLDKILAAEQSPDQYSAEEIATAKKELLQSMMSVLPVFAEMPFFLSDDFSLIDCCIAPLIWRFPALDIVLPPQAQAIDSYAKNIFQRDSFQASLTESERTMRM